MMDLSVADALGAAAMVLGVCAVIAVLTIVNRRRRPDAKSRDRVWSASWEPGSTDSGGDGGGD